MGVVIPPASVGLFNGNSVVVVQEDEANFACGRGERGKYALLGELALGGGEWVGNLSPGNPVNLSPGNPVTSVTPVSVCLSETVCHLSVPCLSLSAICLSLSLSAICLSLSAICLSVCLSVSVCLCLSVSV